jgi:L-iditol 2-dehydrogenase
VKAISFAAPILTYLTTLAVSRLSRRLYVGPHACTRFGDVSEPALPGEHWVRIRTRLGGICGSDLNVVTLNASPMTSPFSSFPFVLGHENVGDVVEVGSAVRRVRVGERVVANPLLCCEPRRVHPPCEACVAGNHSRCAHFTDGALPPGMLIGTTRGTGGSWGEQFVAHESQLVRIPDAMSDEEAVLVEPLACSVHAVRACVPAAGARVLVIGAGSIGLLTTAALSVLAPAATVTVLARHEFQAEHARRLGAARVIASRGDYVGALAEAGQARLLKPIIGRPVGTGGGFDYTFVCAADTRAMDDALRLARAGGTIAMLGNVSTLNGLDWTPVWLKELTVRGSLCYGVHSHGGAEHDTFTEAAALIASGRAPVRSLVSATFPISQYRRALDAALDKGTTHAVKVAFRF